MLNVLAGVLGGLLIAWVAAKLNESFNTRLLVRNKTLDLRIDLMAALLDWEFEVSPLFSSMMVGGFDHNDVKLSERVAALYTLENTFVRRKALSLVYLNKAELEAAGKAMSQLRRASTCVRQMLRGESRDKDFDIPTFEGDLRNARIILGQPSGVDPEVLAAHKELMEQLDKLRR